MSYRTFVNDFQIFETNEFNQELINELNDQGANIKREDEYYEFEIKDINPIIKIVDDYVKEEINKIIDEYRNPYDLTFAWSMKYKENPLYKNIEYCINIETIFRSYKFMQYLYNNGLIKRNSDGTHTILKTITIRRGQ